MVCHYLFPSYLKTIADGDFFWSLFSFKFKQEFSFFNLLAYSSCSSNSKAYVERWIYPNYMKSKEPPPLTGEGQPKATPNPLTFS